MYPIAELLQHIVGLAPVPALLPRLSELLRDPNANLDEIEAIIRCDPNLTASLLRWCNSVTFAGAEPVDTVDDALVRLGFNVAMDIVMTLTTQQIYALPPEAGTKLVGLHEHCLLTGVLTRRLTQNQDKMAGIGFTAGLLHDIGKVLMFKAAPVQYGQTLERAHRKHWACVDQEEEDFGNNHAGLGAEVLGRWKLSSGVVNAIWFHHYPGLCATQQPISCCIELADSLAYAVGHGLRGQYTRHLETSELLEELNLRSDDLVEILQDSLAEFEVMRRGISVAASRAA